MSKLKLVCGRVGSGKSFILASLVNKQPHRKVVVYTNNPKEMFDKIVRTKGDPKQAEVFTGNSVSDIVKHLIADGAKYSLVLIDGLPLSLTDIAKLEGFAKGSGIEIVATKQTQRDSESKSVIISEVDNGRLLTVDVYLDRKMKELIKQWTA